MPQNADPVRLVVVHWNRPNECVTTVRGLLNQGVPLNVTVIDNASSEEAREAVRAGIGESAEIISLPENKGWGPAINAALRKWLDAGESCYCIISAHDAAVSPDCIALLVAAMDQDERIGIA